jgi:hypothetical protein
MVGFPLLAQVGPPQFKTEAKRIRNILAIFKKIKINFLKGRVAAIG